jgi:hypothetical protein
MQITVTLSKAFSVNWKNQSFSEYLDSAGRKWKALLRWYSKESSCNEPSRINTIISCFRKILLEKQNCIVEQYFFFRLFNKHNPYFTLN